MKSFNELWEQIHADSTDGDSSSNPLLDAGDDSKGLAAIRNGLALLNKKKGCGNFWDAFMQLCNNSGALAELLGVKREQIIRWPSKIREGLEKVRNMDASDRDSKPESISTGNPGAMGTQDGNIDPGQPGMTNPDNNG